MTNKLSAAVLGAGAGGQGMAAYLIRKGYRVRIWNRPDPKEEAAWLEPIRRSGTLDLIGWQPGMLPVELASTDLAAVIAGAPVIYVVTTADAHHSLARQMARLLVPGQMVVLISGGTGAALEFRQGLVAAGAGGDCIVAEATSTVVNSRVTGPAQVEVLGEKRRIEFATLPASDCKAAMHRLAGLPFVAMPDVLCTSMTNFGVSVHAVPMVLNAARLEDPAGAFLYYRQGISPAIARVITAVEAERLALAKALGAQTTSLADYLRNSLGSTGDDMYHLINNCAIYATVPAPPAVDHRYLWEDVTTGVVPMVSLAKLVDVPVPLMEATLRLASALLGRDLFAIGRTVERLGLGGLDLDGIRRKIAPRVSRAFHRQER